MKRWLFSLPLALALLLALAPARAEAHPLGNFTVNQYSRLDVGRDTVRLRYIVDMAEIPAFQERQRIDANGDGQISDGERDAYLAQEVPALLANLQLSVNGSPAALDVVAQELSYPAGQGGLLTQRLQLDLAAPMAGSQPVALSYRDSNFPERIGWREIVLRADAGVALKDASAPTTDQTDELRNYPQDMLSSPLDVRAAQASVSFVAGSASPALAQNTAAPAATRVPDQFASLIATTELTPSVIALALLLALLLGAGHALTPGHGKTIVAAYLVGARGTARHAVFLGLTTTITHTAGVFALGFVTLWISNYFLPEQLYPWLEFLSGVMVVGIGIMLFRTRLLGLFRRGAAMHASHEHDHHHHDHDHDHDHDHTHDHDHSHEHDHHHHEHDHAHDHEHAPHTHTHMPPGADGQPVSWRSLLALGISGGLLPCPSALVVLLSAIALHRVAFGMLLIVAFSVGLAGVLTGIGLLLVYARRLFEHFPTDGRLLRALPVASALFVTAAGFAIAYGALVQAGVV